MTFDYTAPQLVIALPDLSLRGSSGRIAGVLPVLLRLDWSSVDNIFGFASEVGTRRVLNDVIYHRVKDVDDRNGGNRSRTREVSALPGGPPFGDEDAAARWRDGRRRPNRGDIEDLLSRLEQIELRESFESRMEQLVEWLDEFTTAATRLDDEPAGEHLVFRRHYLRYVWDDRGRLRAVMTGFDSPYDRARLEAMSAYTEGRPGLVRCDVCSRWFVPLRAGRPSRRCPGFECGSQAQARYQQSPQRREYRRLSTRLSRARAKGDKGAIAAAQADLDELRRMQGEGN